MRCTREDVVMGAARSLDRNCVYFSVVADTFALEGRVEGRDTRGKGRGHLTEAKPSIDVPKPPQFLALGTRLGSNLGPKRLIFCNFDAIFNHFSNFGAKFLTF